MTYHPEELPISVMHYMIVPAAAYDERSWRRWLFEQVGLVELHEFRGEVNPERTTP